VRLPPALAGRGVQTTLALLAYAAFTVVLTWPLTAHLGSTVYLVPPNPPGPGDLGGSIAHLRELVEGHHNPFLSGREEQFNAPDGLPVRWALNVASFPSVLLLYALAAVFGATAAHGLFVMLGYVASGIAMFLLARRLTGSAWIAFIVGWAFAFYPFAVVKGEHPNFIHGWVFVVMLWRFLELIERPTLRNGVWAGLASILCFAWTQYFFLLGGVAFWTLVFVTLAVGAARRRLGSHAVALIPAIVLAVGFVLLMRALLLRASEDETLTSNTLLDVVSTAAHWPMYLVPPAHHPFGGLTVSYLNEHNWNAVEWTLYVGLSILVLAIIGLVAAGARRLPQNLLAPAVAAAALIVVAFVFSLPPELQADGWTVRTPSWLMFHASSSWRLYTRFVMVVMLGLCVLAAFGLRAIVQGRSARVQAAILALATVIVPLDLWNRPPDRTFRIKAPGIYDTLREQPAGIVAEYPLRSIFFVGHYRDLLYQESHGKPILNGYYKGPDEERALRLARLDHAPTAGWLATLGVRYVLLTPERLVPGVPSPGKPGRGFRPIAHDGYGSLFRVTAAPVPLVYGSSGFGPYEGELGEQTQWMGTSPAQLEVIARCTRCAGTLSFTAASFSRPRVLRMRVQNGKHLGIKVVRGPTKISVPVRFSRRLLVDLETDPGPDSIRAVTGADDPRSVSIWVQNARFRPTSAPSG
jgi:hypothetical protein